ncbi:uncharacterized protein LOC119912223 [Micropterus salmoides]|uniref:uncharacterized protein LOC119912223 n=1 Tax=Micropterus salmoides TaxID=27706 RepID=UPI0018ECE405|nr:uncharacterized protein LOC119912223 [Micropterus salmoides]
MWQSYYCTYQLRFVCYNGSVNGTSSFVKVNRTLNWTEAQRYCRENYVDLASIRNQAENDNITNLAAGDLLWIGLHWEQLWSDGSTLLFQFWASGQPDSTEQCVTTSFRNSGLWSDDSCSLTFPFICYSTTPPKTEDFRSIGQNESSITLQWNKVNNNFIFILQFNDAEINITAPDGDGPVTHTVSSLTAATEYTFTLFSVFEDVRSSGVNITAVTAPSKTENFRSIGRDETSITLQWNKVNNNISFILQFNGAEIDITAPDGDGPVTYTVSSLTAGTTYTFTLFSVFENARSSGVSITAATGTRQFYFEATPLNWTEAQSFCRRVYTDLATIRTPIDANAVFRTTRSYRGKAWIGLYGGGWRWSLSNSSFYGEGETEFRNWAPGHPYSPNGQQNCVVLQSYYYYYYYYYFYDYNGKWLDVNCNYPFYSVCYNGSVNGTSTFVKVDTPLNWTEAQRYCRENYVDLASIRDQTENDVIRNLAAGDSVWIGLHSEQLWSDGSTSLFHYWASGQPDSTEQCVTTVFSNSGRWSDDNCSLTFPFICYSTTPPKTEDFRSIGQNESSITLQWNKVNNNFSFILQFNDAEINITAPDGDGPVTHTVSSLTAATEYTFTLFSVFENARSSGVNITAVTAPQNAERFRSTRQDVTSITLQWNKVNNNVSYILLFNSAEIDITAPDGDGPVTYTVSSLIAGTTYTFTLYSVFENARSSGVSITAVTGTRQYYFENTAQNWTEAQSFCRRVYTDLATIETQTDAFAVIWTTPSYRGKAWIGLYGGGWRWSLSNSSFYGEGETEFRNWAPGHPYSPNGQQNCVVLQSYYYYYYYFYDYNGKWLDINCNYPFYSVCYNGSVNGTSTFVKVDTPLNWTEAQRYCRENYVDLASIHDQTENDVIRNLAAGDSVWIGLHLEQLWSDGSTSLFQNWAYGQTDSTEQCVTTVFSNSGLWSDDNCSLTFPFICYSTTPPKTEDFRSIGQNETSITLQWNKVNNNISFILQFNDAEINITSPDGDGPVTYTVSSLTAATEYTFTLFSVFEDVRSSGVNITAVTAPSKTENFRSIGRDESSITLQWNKVNNNISFILLFNGAEIDITAPDGDGPVTYTVSSLTAGTTYTFTLFSVFENVRSSGVSITAVTGTRQFYFEARPLNWTEAQSFCRRVYTDLATIRTPIDANALLRTTQSYTGKAWIGLYGDSWRWSLNDSSFYNEGETGFRNWAPGHPYNPYGQQYCVLLQSSYNNDYYFNYYYYYLDYNGKWWDYTCNNQQRFVCYNGSVNGTSSFVKVNTSLNWTEAQRYCRENYVDLASIRNRAENDIITKLTVGDSVWIGLHLEQLWSDGSTSLFQNWASGQPDSPEQCVTTAFRNSGRWSDDNCSLSFPFICYSTTLPKTEDFRSIGQDETSITLQWNKVNNNISFILQFNDAEINITAPDGDGPVTYRVASLTAATEYTFTLFSVFENARSSGVNITAVTAPSKTENVRSIGRDETSITLQWNKVNNNIRNILQFNGAEIYITAPDGDGPVTYTVSSLTAGTKYTFTLFSVFENARSSGVSITAVTGTRQFYFEATPLNWTEAQSFCRRVYTDLATIRTPIDANAVFRTTRSYRGKAWIGLYGDRWRWSLSDSSFYGEGETGFRNWAPGYPYNPYGQQHCVVLQSFYYYYYYYYSFLDYNGKWLHVHCNNQQRFVCYNGKVNGTSSFVKVDTPLNWTEAQRYCRENYVDLASIRNRAENYIITKLTAGDNVWIGLYLDQLWSDGSTSLFQNWAYGQPDSTAQCVTTVFRNSGLWSDDNCSLSFPFICYSITSPKTEDFRSIGQDETRITLQWNKVNNNFSFILQFNDAEINITAPDGDGPVTHTVSSLTAATEYTFTLFSVFENVRSSGVNITAVTAPPNAENFISTAQDETSITLQWNKVNNNISFILQFNSAEIDITAPDGDGPVTYTVSSLTAATTYTFILFSVYKNARSSGVSVTAVTALVNVASTRQYYFVSTPLNWTEAQSFCRQVYTDLATIENTTDVRAVLRTTPSYTGKAWIGLYDHSWRWSLSDSSFYGEGETEFRNWAPGHPFNPYGVQLCVVLQNYYYNLNAFGTWVDLNCTNKFFFVCYNGSVNGTSPFVKINKPLNWTEAQRYCRENYVDLARIQNRTENDIITNLAAGHAVWIGLHWEQLWSDGSTSLFENWFSGQLQSKKQCVTTTFTYSGQWSDDSCSLTFPFICYSTPSKTENFRSIGQDETSITLQWNKVNNNISFILQFNGAEIDLTAPDDDGPVTHTVSSLTAATKYTFTLFSVFENVRSSGVNITAVTAPPKAESVISIGQDETSITLQWNKVKNNVNFILQFNDAEINITAPDGDGPVTHTVSSLTAATTYTFTLYSVFENVRSSGVNFTAVTGPNYVLGTNVELESLTPKLSDSDLQSVLENLFRRYGLSPQFSFKVLRRVIRKDETK